MAAGVVRAPVLVVAAGGGGDALAAYLVARSLSLPADSCVFATVVWERTIFDPSPGPRSPSDFTGLRPVADENHLLTPDAALHGEGETFVPRLGESLGVGYHLLDLSRGAQGVEAQLAELYQHYRCRSVLIVDVGGDILATGDEEGLSSPLSDSLVLAGASGFGRNSVVAVTGLGLDGELSYDRVRRACRTLRLEGPGSAGEWSLRPDVVRQHLEVFRWFPSEVTGLACLASVGCNGVAEIRTAGIHVTVEQRKADIELLAYSPTLKRNALASRFRKTTTFRQAENILRRSGRKPETDVERDKRERLSDEMNAGEPADLSHQEEKLLEYSRSVFDREVDFLTMRRIAEILKISHQDLLRFIEYLSDRHPQRIRPPVWRTRSSDA